MIISVQDNLKEVILNLQSLGYNVHKFSEGVPSDIYIYKDEELGLSNLTNHIRTPDRGALLINIDNKSMKEILYAINNRTYSPLF